VYLVLREVLDQPVPLGLQDQGVIPDLMVIQALQA